MPLISRKQFFALIVGTTLACGEGPTGTTAGNLLVTVSGLPAGSVADLLISGPGGFSQSVTGTQTLTQLTAGTYTVIANDVVVGPVTYAGSPGSQSLAVGGSTATASIHYSTGAGNLSISISGLGTSSNAAVTVTGPNNYSQSITASQTLAGLTAGTYTVAAQDVVANGGTPHTPTPATQNISVPATGVVSAAVSYAPPDTGLLNLRIAGLYISQSSQTFEGAVPLVKDRDGYLRVFAVANRTNTSAPAVRVRVYNAADAVLLDKLIPTQRFSVPTWVDESQLTYSWNTPIAGALIQPGFRVDAQVDAGGIVPEGNEADNLLAPPAPVVSTVPNLNLTFVPIVQSNGLTGNVTAGNKEEFLSLTQKMHPIAGYSTVVGTPLIVNTTTDTLEADNGNDAWGKILLELDAKRLATDPSRYYYGVAKVSYTSGVAGVAYVSTATAGQGSALGWDYLPTGAAVMAHELGHNWSRNHAPCGGPGGVDNSYPYPDGRTGLYGIDVAAQTLKPATTSDIMGYCDPKWIGDYTYKGVMNYLISPPPSAPVVAAAGSQAVQPCLLVWGHIRNGVMILEPSLRLNARPSLPRQAGPYTVEGKSEDGVTLFRLAFSPNEVADVHGTQRSFVFMVPLSDANAGRLSTVRLAGMGGETIRKRSVVPGAQVAQSATSKSAQVRRIAGSKVEIRWDSLVYPMVMVREAGTGEVLSFARAGRVEIPGPHQDVDLVYSDGVRSKAERVVVAP